VLSEVVRQDQGSKSFEITEWEVKRLSDKGIINPDGLFLFSGQGHDEHGTRSWSVVLKNLKDPGGEPNLRSMFYWKREALLIQNGLLSNLPGPVIVPRYYGTVEGEGGVWVWMEHIVESVTSLWTADQYRFAARQVGRFNAACFAHSPIPDLPWLCKRHLQSWLEIAASFNTSDSAFVKQAFSSQLQERVNRLWDERERFLSTLDRLPQVFSHFDVHRRNLIIRQREGRDELVAIDWALCGHGALGGDAFSLIPDNMLVFEVEPAAVAELEAAVYPAYLEGLREGGWQGNPELVRLAYTAWTALYTGAAAPALVTAVTSENMLPHVPRRFGRSPDEVASGWAIMCKFSLDRADEARVLMDKLGF